MKFIFEASSPAALQDLTEFRDSFIGYITLMDQQINQRQDLSRNILRAHSIAVKGIVESLNMIEFKLKEPPPGLGKVTH